MIGLKMFTDGTLGDNSDQELGPLAAEIGINSARTPGVRSTPISDRKGQDKRELRL